MEWVCVWVYRGEGREGGPHESSRALHQSKPGEGPPTPTPPPSCTDAEESPPGEGTGGEREEEECDQ